MAGLHPFSVFQEEVWPLIGQKLGDSVEILKLIQTIPEIEGAMHAKKRYWIFDQIIPLLSKFLKTEDKLACRQVCTQWSQAVDNFLENYPPFRAYQHGSQVTGQIWINNEGRPAELLEGDLYLMSNFYSQESITNFLEKMRVPGRRRNPFLCRGVLVHSSGDMEVLTGMKNILEPFGQHVWTLMMVDVVDDVQHREPRPFCDSLREWLDHLPNLKTLGLVIPPLTEIIQDPNVQLPGQAEETLNQLEADPISAGSSDDYLERWKEPLPPLPELESIVICSSIIPPLVISALVNSYSTQLRSLELSIGDWKPDFPSAFPSLTELSVNGIPSSVRLNTLLPYIHIPLLYELGLCFEEGCVLEVGTDILPWLQRFPLLRNLAFQGDAKVVGVGSDEKLSPAACSIPSVKYLRVGIQYLFANSDFLLCFPNLEYIHLEFTAQHPEGTLLEPTLKIWQPLITLRMYESNVWELLSKLKGLCLTPHGNDEVETHFKRGTYDYRQKLLAQASN